MYPRDRGTKTLARSSCVGRADTRKRFFCRGKLLQDRNFSSISLVRFVRLTTISSDDRCGERNTRFHVEWVSHGVDFFNPCEWCFNRVNSTYFLLEASIHFVMGTPKQGNRSVGSRRKAPISASPERRNSRKSKPEYLHVWQMLKRMRYSSIPLGVERPSIARRSLARALIACSALLLFQGTPSWLRKVNSLPRSLSNRAFNFDAAALKCSILDMRL